MNLSNFENSFSRTILERGRNYYRTGKVISINRYSVSPKNDTYKICVKGTKRYTVYFSVDEYETVRNLSCDCPYEAGYCKHEAAALYAVNNMLIKEEKFININYTNKGKDNLDEKNEIKNVAIAKALIDKYNIKNRIDSEIEQNLNNIHLYPHLVKLYGQVFMEMKIGEVGKKRTYVINNMSDFIYRCDNKLWHSYGKELDFTHSYDVFDEESEKLFYFVKNINERTAGRFYTAGSKKYLILGKEYIADFLRLYKDKEVFYDKNFYNVALENYPAVFKLDKEEENIYKMIVSPSSFKIISDGLETILENSNRKIIYVCDKDYSAMITEVLKSLKNNKNKLYISEKDMPAFYKNVLSQILKFCQINGLDIISHMKPPELKACLYIDTPKEDAVMAKLVFNYDKKEYDPYFKGYYENPIADIKQESIVKAKVGKYFDVYSNSKDYNLILEGNDSIYNFISEGIKELSGNCEIFTSESFNKISSYKKIPLSVGVRIESNLLELEIDVGNYSVKELSEVLESYKKGNKYHRLKSGEFINLDDKLLEEFSEMKDALYIKDEDILNGKTEIPKYRMLYLDALKKNNEELNINESKELYKELKKYKALSEAGDFNLCDRLDNIMREYQKDGFRWFKTICGYHFGGILADDMGLGKTIQAIALMQSIKEENTDKRFLVVCPAFLVLNWESEIKKFAPDLKSISLVGTVSERKEKFEKISEYDVIITSYNLMVKDIKSYKDIEFCIHFIDEAQYIKNYNTQAAKASKLIKSETRFALTGTPIENSLAELWSIFDFVMPGYLYGYRYFKNNFESPIVKSKDEKKTKALQKIVAPFILRRMKKDVLKELPDKTETILKSEMSDIQRKLYLANLMNFKKTAKEKTESEGEKSRFEVFAMLTKLRQLCCDPRLVYSDYDGKSAKLEQCIELVSNCVEAGHKILLFSQFTSMLDIIKDNLEKEGISHYMLTGKTKHSDRLDMVNRFNEDETKVFLISLKAGGTGLNLTGADIVIHYDPWWNISAENQASDRAYRIGQKKNVQIYKLISENTIEEKIYALQQAKAELTEITNGGENITQMSLSDILDLFE